MKNTSITIDAFLPSFGASASLCMCEVKILSTQTFSRLRISQEGTFLPPENCGLRLKIVNSTETIQTVECSYIGDTEYLLYQGSSIVMSLTNISENWSEGFCFNLSLRFGKFLPYYIHTVYLDCSEISEYNYCELKSTFKLAILSKWTKKDKPKDKEISKHTSTYVNMLSRKTTF